MKIKLSEQLRSMSKYSKGVSRESTTVGATIENSFDLKSESVKHSHIEESKQAVRSGREPWKKKVIETNERRIEEGGMEDLFGNAKQKATEVNSTQIQGYNKIKNLLKSQGLLAEKLQMSECHIFEPKITTNFLQKYKRKKIDPARMEKTLHAKEERKKEELVMDRNLMFKKNMENDLILTDSKKIAELRLTHNYRRSSKKKSTSLKFNILSKYDSKGFLKEDDFDEVSGNILEQTSEIIRRRLEARKNII